MIFPHETAGSARRRSGDSVRSELAVDEQGRENARLKRTGYIVQVQSNSSISIIRPSG